MALLVFDEAKLTPPLEAILDPQLRMDIAKQVNEAILRANGEASGARLIEILKTRVWAEAQARKLGKLIPQKIDIGLDPPQEVELEREGHGDGNGEDQTMAG